MRLLVVEDEKSLRDDITKKLRLDGYEADACGDGNEARELLAVERYDLVLLDINLPGADGMTILREFRTVNYETPVLILSARSEITDKVEGLDAGANDYLSKPFHLAVALTRKETGVLEYLMLHEGRPVSQEELIEHVWDGSVDSFSNSIRVHISALRRKLRAALGYDPVVNLVGEGYVIGGDDK